jgi:hypothetical protein
VDVGKSSGKEHDGCKKPHVMQNTAWHLHKLCWGLSFGHKKNLNAYFCRITKSSKQDPIQGFLQTQYVYYFYQVVIRFYTAVACFLISAGRLPVGSIGWQIDLPAVRLLAICRIAHGHSS